MHPCHAGPHLPCFVLSNPGAFVVNINIVVVANALPGEATNMQEFGAVFVIKMMPSHFLERNSLISHTMLMNWGGREQLLKVTKCQEGGKLHFHMLWEIRASWWGATAKLGSAPPLLSFQVSQPKHSALLHLSTLLLPSCLFRCN